MQRLIRILNQPMNDSCSLAKSFRSMFIVAVFVAFFLWFFEPFGISGYQGNKGWLAIRFGLITLAAGFLVEFIEIKVVKLNKEHPSWTLKHWLLSSVFILLAISLGNFIFINYLSGWDGLTFSIFLRFILNTTAIGLFPIIIVGVTSLKRHEKSNLEIAGSMHIPEHETDQQKVILPNQNGEDLEITANELLFIEAMQNYVAVYHLNGENVSKTLLRNTLKSLLHSVSVDSFFQCHRSFAVNLDHVTNISGNSQGLTLTLKQAPEITLPVSRRYIPDLRNELKELA